MKFLLEVELSDHLGDFELVSVSGDSIHFHSGGLVEMPRTIVFKRKESVVDSGSDDGASLIASERKRQVSEEGWSAEHDDKHKNGEMVRAAICYAVYSYFWRNTYTNASVAWPWAAKWWKPDNKRTVNNLVKAGALIAAEIDRLIRIEKQRAEEAIRHDRV